MKKLFSLILLFLNFDTVYAQNNTDEMLGAPKARDYVQLWPDFNQKTFFYTIDSDKNKKRNKTLDRRITFGVPQRDKEIAVTMRFYNPLKYSVETNDILSADPSFVSVGRFVSALTDLIKQLPNAPDVSNITSPNKPQTSNNITTSSNERNTEGSPSIQTSGYFDPTAVKLENNLASEKLSNKLVVPSPDEYKKWAEKMNEIRSEHLAEWKYLSTQGKVACLDQESSLLKQLEKLDSYYFNTWYRNKIKVGLSKLSSKETMQELKNENSKFQLLLDTLKRNTLESKNLLKSFDEIVSDNIEKYLLKKEVYTKVEVIIETKAGKTDTTRRIKPDELCQNFASYSQIVFKRFIRACTDNQTRRDRMLELAEKLTAEIDKTLQSADETDYDENGLSKLQNAFIIGRYNIFDDRMRDISIAFKKRMLNLETDPPTISDTDEKITGRIRLRSSQTFIPEFSTGVYYTNLTYPTYGTYTLTSADLDALNNPATGPRPTIPYTSGQSIVRESNNERVPFVIAGMLNITLNAFDGLIHPVIQLGVGTGKDRPTLLAGLGVRLKWINPVVISAGTIWAWKKTLTSLSENGIVSGTEQIDKDLSYKLDSNPKLYIGIQVNFQ